MMAFSLKEYPRCPHYLAQIHVVLPFSRAHRIRVSFMQGAQRLHLIVDPSRTKSNTVDTCQ